MLSVADLRALPSARQNVTFTAAGVPQSHNYLGAPVWAVLEAAGIKADPANKRIALGKYVLATGADGYRATFSIAELDPAFGNRGNLIAYAEEVAGATVALKDDARIQITAPGDVKGGRYVSSLVRLEVLDPASRASGGIGGGPSSSFAVAGAVQRPASFDLAALKALPAVERSVGGVVYQGTSLWNLLDATMGLVTQATVKNDILSRYVVATGSDGYQALFTLGELDPGFGAQSVLIAYAADGTGLGDKGFARLVVPGDKKAGRWVANLIRLEVFAAP